MRVLAFGIGMYAFGWLVATDAVSLGANIFIGLLLGLLAPVKANA